MSNRMNVSRDWKIFVGLSFFWIDEEEEEAIDDNQVESEVEQEEEDNVEHQEEEEIASPVNEEEEEEEEETRTRGKMKRISLWIENIRLMCCRNCWSNQSFGWRFNRSW